MLNLKLTAAGVLVTLLASCAVATGADGATYYACAKKKGGAMRLVARSAHCRRSERKISFNSTGAPGKNGLDGRNGINGANGSNGTNGADGTTGFTATLPHGQTETGTWAALPNGSSPGYAAISFNIPLASAPAALVTEATPEGPKPPCLGTVAKPSAEPGHLCIYIDTRHFGGSVGTYNPVTGEEGAATFGTLVSVSLGAMDGTWAVTA